MKKHVCSLCDHKDSCANSRSSKVFVNCEHFITHGKREKQPMKIYLAARYGRRLEMLEIANALRDMGHSVTSRWINGEHELLDAARFALKDLADINDADALALFIDDTTGRNRGGKDVEFGIAIGKNMPVYHVVMRTNVFTYLPRVTHYDTIKEFLDAMKHHVMFEPTDGYSRHCAVCGGKA